jgi:hypothetical protein
MATLGDYFRNASNLFKSTKQKEKEKARERRQATRRAEMALDDVKQKLKELDRDGKKAWDRAREALQGGRKAAAQRELTAYRAKQVLASKIDQKRFVFEQKLTDMEMAKTDVAFTDALRTMATVVDIDPETVDDVLLEVDTKSREQGEVDRLWQKEYRQQMEGVQDGLEDFVPTLDDLSKQLEDEVAEDVGTSESSAEERELGDQISEGRERIHNLLDEEGKGK